MGVYDCFTHIAEKSTIHDPFPRFRTPAAVTDVAKRKAAVGREPSPPCNTKTWHRMHRPIKMTETHDAWLPHR